MDLSSAVLGSGIAAQLQERVAAIVLEIGRDQYTRADLASVACFNFQAAANLSHELAKLEVRDTRYVFDHISPAELAVPRLGAIAIAVLGAAFESKRIGGDAPLVAWVRRHAASPTTAVHTFVSLKVREAKERAAEKAAARTRRRARRSTAHRLRRDRFLARTEATT